MTESKHRPELLRQAAIGLGLLGDRDVVADLIAMLSASTTSRPRPRWPSASRPG